ncbi:glutathione S-transferase family protein [Dyella sp. SG609]|uniref:glutathione S-transferase family protein n=1 Tax=Dyella sp. SG609 TaxID=2587018 RepID=UPI0014479282|nr:glutathione S-transferase family protein [Dyella sp. SG609]NKJ23382.1 glutathione S-transferase [Dyella sp. SG609]
MKLLYQTHSPYARKVLVAAHETGLAGQLDVIHHETSPTRRNEAVYAVNPLGKVPVLLLDDGEVLFDSGVICEYLDGLHGGPKLIPMQTAARYGVLRMQALAQGIADAGIAARWDIERRPEALRWPVLVDAYREKIAATCDYLEREIDEGAVDLGTIALATALSWIEFREVYDFRAGRPRLAAWYERFSSRASMQATALSGATHD